MATMTRVGDVFRIPLDSGTVGYGHAVAKLRPIFYMAAYDIIGHPRREPPVSEIAKAPILFLGNFFDVLIKKGYWKIIGNVNPDISRIPFPCYKVKIHDQYYVESWDGERRRPANPEEILLLDNRTDSGPILLETAVKAHYGKEPWEAEFNRFLPEYVSVRSLNV